MTFVAKESHQHKFVKRVTEKVLLSSGKSSSKRDVLKQLVCTCGKTLTYDLERFNT